MQHQTRLTFRINANRIDPNAANTRCKQGDQMAAATDFADLHEGSIAYSASRAGALADVAHWRGIAELCQDREQAQRLRADRLQHELDLAMARLEHIVCCDGSLALCEWSAHVGQWLDMRDGMSFGELLHQVDDDRLLTERQARDAWEARQADEIAQIAARNSARRAA